MKKKPDNAMGEPKVFPGGIKRWQLKGDDPVTSPQKYLYISSDGKSMYVDYCMTMTRGFKWVIADDNEVYLDTFIDAEAYIFNALKN